MSILSFKNVNKGFGVGIHRAEVLKDINLEVKEGEFLAILGFSGTGKSTLMNLIAGLEKPDSGTLTYRGKPITEPGPERGLIFQSYSLMPWLTVGGNVGLQWMPYSQNCQRQNARQRSIITLQWLVCRTQRRAALPNCLAVCANVFLWPVPLR